MRIAIGAGLGLLHLALSMMVIMAVNGLGFPDGHLTELDQAYRDLSAFVVFPLMVLGGNYLALALISRAADTRLWLRWSLGVSVVVIVGALGVGLWLGTQLEDGAGGLRATPSLCKIAGWYSSELSLSA